MGNKSSHRRNKHQGRVMLIEECEWCQGAFARQMHDGTYCNEVCRYQHREQMRCDGNPRGLTAEQLIDAIERESTG